MLILWNCLRYLVITFFSNNWLITKCCCHLKKRITENWAAFTLHWLTCFLLFAWLLIVCISMLLNQIFYSKYYKKFLLNHLFYMITKPIPDAIFDQFIFIQNLCFDISSFGSVSVTIRYNWKSAIYRIWYWEKTRFFWLIEIIIT